MRSGRAHMTLALVLAAATVLDGGGLDGGGLDGGGLDDMTAAGFPSTT